MIRWTTTRQASQTHGVKVLVYGGPGVGKTSLCKTAPAPVIISAEGGMLSLAKQDIPMTEISTIEQLTEVYQWCLMSQEARHVQTVCLDSCTEIAEVLLQHLKTTNKDPRKAYGEMLDCMMKLVRAFRDLPGKHVYIAAQMAYDKDEVTGVSQYQPLMPGQKLGPKLPYIFDEVFHLGVGRDPKTQQNYRYLQTGADLQYAAKDRSGALDFLEPPDLTHVFRKILGG